MRGWLLASTGCALLAVLLAWPVPQYLAGAEWTRRHPRSAIALWQVVELVGGMSAVASLLLVGLAPMDRHPIAFGVGAVNALFLLLAALLFAWLVGVLAAGALKAQRDLRRQRVAVDLLAHPGANGLRVLDYPEPLAYCLPGPRPRIVITGGAIAALPPDELTAVLAHERAHALGRHELVIQPFVAWQRALPFLAPARQATAAVAELVEMLADDAAAKATSPRTVARALARVGSGRPPGGGTAPGRRTGTGGGLPAPDQAVAGTTEVRSVLARVRRLS
ncbi:MAG TPA: M56 family metallopeptidase [Actinocrinis sp.]|jgi:Zn-dependent protease with chaperone function